MILAALLFLAAPPVVVTSGNTLAIGGGEVEIVFDGKGAGVSNDVIRKYISRAAQAATLYYGHFPVKHVEIDVGLGGSLHVGHGVTWMGRKITIDVGRAATEDDLAGDWRMTHEMFHLGFPDLDDDYLYLEEGLSTYLEPIARARLGDLSAARVWTDTIEGMPQGLPGKHDKGLDHTHTWGRTYWGGALFWLECDAAIREQTKGKKSLDDAIRAVLDAGGDGSEHWDPEQVFAIGDKATGTKVLTEMHERYGLKATSTDLDALWKKLGLEKTPTGYHLAEDGIAAHITAAP